MLSKLAQLFKILILAVIIPIILFGLYTWAALSWVYSTGERAGYVQKFSEKGYICKTYEGELAYLEDLHKEKILKNSGFEYARIWSQNWWQNPERELKKWEDTFLR